MINMERCSQILDRILDISWYFCKLMGTKNPKIPGVSHRFSSTASFSLLTLREDHLARPGNEIAKSRMGCTQKYMALHIVFIRHYIFYIVIYLFIYIYITYILYILYYIYIILYIHIYGLICGFTMFYWVKILISDIIDQPYTQARCGPQASWLHIVRELVCHHLFYLVNHLQCGAPTNDSSVGANHSNNYGLWYANNYS